MSISTIEKVIGDHVYTFKKMNNDTRIPMMAKLTKVLGKSVPTLFGAKAGVAPEDSETLEAIKAKEAFDSGVEGARALSSEHEVLLLKQYDKEYKAVVDATTAAIGMLIDNMDKENVPQLLKDLITKSEVTVDGRRVDYNLDFQDLSHLFEILFHICYENYASVFRLGGVIGA